MTHKPSPMLRSTSWVKGQSGNPAGKPVGTRNAFSQLFLSDLAASWSECGPEVLAKVARADPARYLGVCSTLIPKDVAISIEARQSPLDDHDLEILRACREAIPNVGELSPQQVFELTLSALRAHLSSPAVALEASEVEESPQSPAITKDANR
jgi:Family of unknown function (DUF5681)